MYTEKQAFAMWSPIARVIKVGNFKASYNRLEKEDGALCIGSACMVWRWAPDTPATEGPDVGYCGLAGGPSLTLP